jgi:16S rRNA (guanine527-N7)-methyltransferase
MYDVGVIRAVGSLREILELTIPLVCVGGRVLALKGRSADEELAESEKALTLLHARRDGVRNLLPDLSSDSVVVVCQKTQSTDDIFPRRSGMPKKRPL